MAKHLGPIAAIAHRAPSPILSLAFVDKEPAASALILALTHFPGTGSHEQPDGRPRDRLKQVVRRAVALVRTPYQPAFRRHDAQPVHVRSSWGV